MHAQRIVSTVGENGLVHISTDLPEGTQVEVVALRLEADIPTAASDATMLAQSGFLKEVLGNPAEDVWNDL